MNFYTVVLRQSSGYWLALCLENGIVAQGNTQEEAVNKLKEAIASFEIVYESESDIYKYPISIDELHEFLFVEGKSQTPPQKKHQESVDVNAVNVRQHRHVCGI
ncbi:Uncharacterized protein family (UPF0150) [Cylindrospermum stagnale PCC 7417]|uniref:Uncharacterized protein family (UPF0150) n=1 Tax=Cylindrospermum stagnale PCC 7417 TaxID=56107 RepID=K9WXA4_9NOST|nr:Uncharacterized protein family (UPF0150) [Cylindrospermum stagnale PCC 7417]